MIYTKMTKLALRLCFDAHKEQNDKSGMPYVFHPFHLAEQTETEDETVVALLHDVVEDTGYTLDDLRGMGFNCTVIEAIAYMTHDEAVPYMDYIRKIKENPVARKVKLCDLRHNSDVTRLGALSDKDRARIAKYAEAIKILEG